MMSQNEKQVNLKQKKPQVSIEAIKDVVKKLKNSGLEKLNHFQLALTLVTIGFKQACKQFGVKWTQENEQYALKILQNSEYDLNWYGKINNRPYTQLLTLTLRGDIQKIKSIASTVDHKNKAQLLKFTSTVDNFKRTALHLAIKQNFDILAQFLINKGFSLNARDQELKTPVHYCKSQLTCQILIQKGANIFVKDFKLCTPAHYAAQLNNSKVLQIILKKSNIVNQCDLTLKSPIFYAIFNTSEQQVNILRVLIQNGAKLNETDLQGRTPIHYAAESGKSRCIPFLLQRGASIIIRDKYNKTALDLASNQKIKKIIEVYSQNKGIISDNQQKQKRKQFYIIQNSHKANTSQMNILNKQISINTPIYTKQLNQVSTWVREKFFVLMKKLQQSGIKANWHLKRPYIYTGSWAEEVQSLEDLYETFINVNGSEAVMRAFNILCPYQKPLPRVVGKGDQVFQSFFGQNWFSNDPIQKIRNMHSQSKIKTELQLKIKQSQNLRTELLGYRNQMQKLQTEVSELQSQLKRYYKIEDDLRKQRVKNTNQYSKILQLMSQKQQLKQQIQNLVGGQETTKILSHQLQEQKLKNQNLLIQIENMKSKQAATRRKCGKIFLKSLSQASNGQKTFKLQQNNLFDDDAIINLYDLLKQNPPNLQKRFQKADKKGKGKLTVQQFTILLEDLSMLPQNVMSMHRIIGFAHGRITLSMDEFKTILQNRHKNRPMWQKKLIKKIKNILTESNMTIQKLFQMIDNDNSGTIQANQLRIGLESYNIFMNHTDWCNLFNLLDSDKSGQIDLNELKLLLDQEKSGKLQNISKIKNQQEEQVQDPQQNQKPAQKIVNIVQDNDKQDNKSQKVSYQSRSQIANSILNQQQFNQPYQQQDQDEAKGIQTINGIFTIQVPKIQVKSKIKDIQYSEIYLKFSQNDEEYVKLVDLTIEELEVAVEFKKKKFKIHQKSDLDVVISAWIEREQIQENYLGEMKINLFQILLESKQQWKQSKHKLEAIEFTRNIPKTQLILAIKWVSKTYEQMLEQSQLEENSQDNQQKENRQNSPQQLDDQQKNQQNQGENNEQNQEQNQNEKNQKYNQNEQNQDEENDK